MPAAISSVQRLHIEGASHQLHSRPRKCRSINSHAFHPPSLLDSSSDVQEPSLAPPLACLRLEGWLAEPPLMEALQYWPPIILAAARGGRQIASPRCGSVNNVDPQSVVGASDGNICRKCVAFEEVASRSVPIVCPSAPGITLPNAHHAPPPPGSPEAVC
jgi:hypothetical protein